jgi:hypothetical protein
VKKKRPQSGTPEWEAYWKRYRRQEKVLALTGLGTFCLVLLLGTYWATAAFCFQWRNPKANSVQLIREFPSVITFQRLDRYQ